MQNELWIPVYIMVGGTIAWWLFLDIRYSADQRLASWWRARARRWGRWTGPISLLLSAALVSLYCAIVLTGTVLAKQHDSVLWALLLAVPSMLVYGPFAFATSPMKYSAYRSWRSELRAAGASVQEQRRIAWWAGIPSLLGLATVTLTPLWIFNS